MNRFVTGIALALILSSMTARANDVLAVQAEIDRTVWKAFQAAFESLDGDALNAVYAESVLRVTPEGIDSDGVFKKFNSTRFNTNKANGDQISLDFWFDSRHTNLTTSYDVGFYRVGTKSSAGATSYFYGQFHIVLQKIDGNWKIVQDWDTSVIAGRAISAEEFARQEPRRF